ncbi:hypothetical protein B7C42_04532 [Nocardia cerradoensis]|uniref:DUF4345 domain-containing protein n=1 Tax=Nocardia cerradoensis TaxID=85688 RepID=A0A231H475_9NOCA|nr:DUF4345 family protein [Nocardia cerradoensis]OXR43664.1 hypothetical protein B7C42_04532 [Nocardia cerradoensis]
MNTAPHRPYQDRLVRAYLAIAACAFLLIGLNGLFAPVRAAAGIGFEILTSAGLNEMRANYGGLQLALAGLLAGGAVRAAVAKPALALTVAVCGGLVFGRLVGFAIDGPLEQASCRGLYWKSWQS